MGKFDLPIHASFSGQQVTVGNRGSHPLRSIIQIHVQGTSIEVAKLERLQPNEQHKFAEPKAMSAEELAALVERSLIAEGLYEKEAKAMVATWQQSWFTEEGTRVLYMVPTSVTESLLPLHVSPQPQETVRVLVGRLEIMSPESEQQMIQSVASSAGQRKHYYATASQRNPIEPYPIPKSILDFGRMAEPALIRVSKIAKDNEVRQEAELLISQFQQ